MLKDKNISNKYTIKDAFVIKKCNSLLFNSKSNEISTGTIQNQIILKHNKIIYQIITKGLSGEIECKSQSIRIKLIKFYYIIFKNLLFN